MGSRETDYSQHSHQHGTVMPSKNIILVSSPGLAATRTRRAGTEKNYNLWAGGSATLVTPDTNNGDVILAELECVPSVVKYKVQSDNTSRPRASKRKVEEDLLDPEEDAKRKMRRNRNRLAAAKCRQKRLDQISELQVEVTNWERRNRSLEEEVAALREEKVKVEQVESEGKQESPAFFDNLEQMTVKPQRPVSLSLTPVSVKNKEGVPIDTPSNGILSFNTLLEGRTGLTPTNILTPTSLWASVKASPSLNTPNCSTQQRSLAVTDLLSPSTQALLTSL